MLDSLRGRVLGKGDDFVVVECGGVGFRMRVPRTTAAGACIGADGSFCCRLTFKDDAFQLYGFATESERDVFVVLQSVSGLGPEKALALLNALEPAQIAIAVEERDARAFERVKGVGSKLSQRIVLELEGRLARFVDGTRSSASGRDTRAKDLAATLVNLGFAKPAAERTAGQVIRDSDADATLERLVKLALSRLASTRARESEA